MSGRWRPLPFAVPAAALGIVFIVFVYGVEERSRVSLAQRLTHGSRELIDAVWTLDTPKAHQALERIILTEDLAAGYVLHRQGDLFLHHRMRQHRPGLLERWGLAATPVLTIPLRHPRGEQIGWLRVTWPNRNFPLYLGVGLLLLAFAALIRYHLVLRKSYDHLRETSAALQRSEEQYHRIASQASDILWTTDMEMRFTFVSPSAERILGYAPAELIGLSPHDLLAPEAAAEVDRTYAEVLQDLEQDTVWTLSVQHRHQDGSLRDCEVTGALLRDGNGMAIGITGVTRDVTERRRLEHDLRHAEKMQAVGQLAGGIAHDFNNRLVSIQGFAQLLEAELADGEHRDYAARILRAAQRAAQLTRQMLDFARKGDSQNVIVDMHRLIQEVLLLLERSLDKRFRIRQELHAPAATVSGDPTQLQNVILNLTINARDAMPEGGTLTLTTEHLELDAAAASVYTPPPQPGPCLAITIADTGAGIAPELRERIFEPFFTTKARTGGTGMGLSSAYGAIASHAGGIAVESEVGAGACFRLVLPLATEAEKPTDRFRFDRAAHAARILIIEDETEVREFARIVLRRLGHKVLACANGQEGVALFRRNRKRIDLVLLDMFMPDLTGREVYAQLQAEDTEVRVLLVTGYSETDEAQALLREGVLDVLAKPFDMGELNAKIEAALSLPRRVPAVEQD